MIAFIKGTLASRNEDYAVIENNGIGYQVFMPSPFSMNLNEDYTIYTYQHVREDAILLFGFLSDEERLVFMKLISVKGVGPKTAIHMLAVCPASQMIQAIEEDDVKTLKGLPGIGAKTASQIVLDLKGKLVVSGISTATHENQNLKNAMDGLLALGYKQKEIDNIAKELAKEEEVSVQVYMKKALVLLARAKGV